MSNTPTPSSTTTKTISSKGESQTTEKEEIEFNGNKLKLEKKLENDSINFYLSSNSFKDFKGSLSLEDIISKIPAFEDYNIQEALDIINEVKPDKYTLIEESGKFSLNITMIILKKEKKLKINLEEIQKSKEQIISDLEITKIENSLKIKKLKEKYNKLFEECKQLQDKKEDLVKNLEGKAKSKKKDTTRREEPKELYEEDENYKEFMIEDKNVIFELTTPNNIAKGLTVLKDGRLVLGANNEIIVFSPETFKIALKIKEEDIEVDNLIGLSTGKLLSLEKKQNFKIYNIKENGYEIIQNEKLDAPVNCIKEMENKSICITYNKTIATFNLKEDDFTYNKKIDITSNLIEYYGFAEINFNQICVSTKFERREFLSFYQLNLMEPYAVTKGIPLTSFGDKLNKDLLYFYKNNCIYLIGTTNYKLVAKFELEKKADGSPNDILSLCLLTSYRILISDSENNLIQLAIKNKKISESSRESLGYSTGIICSLGNGKIATYHGNNEAEGKIQIW